MDRELLKALGELLDEKLGDIKSDVSSLKSDVSSLKSNVSSLKSDVSDLKSNVSDLKSDIETLKVDVGLIKTQQKEHGVILRILEDKANTNKAEHDKLSNDINHLSGKVEDMKKDLATVQVVTARNMENIANFKIAK